MARKALLTHSQCARVRALYDAGSRAVELAKKFGVSESSLYKVLDGSYRSRPDEPRRMAAAQSLPVIAPDKPMGITPSLFGDTARSLNQDLHPTMAQMIEKARQIDDVELDDLTIAAAELVVAKARLNRVLAHVH